MVNEHANLNQVLEFIGVSEPSYISQLGLKEFSSFKDWMRKNFEKINLEDIVKYGCSGGFGGLTYYSDTTALYRHFNGEIWEMLNEDSENMGSKNICEFIGTFGGANNVGSAEQFENLIVWYAAERIASELLEEEENKNIENDQQVFLRNSGRRASDVQTCTQQKDAE